MNLQSWIMIIGIFIVMVLPQLGEKKYSSKRIVIQIALVGYLAYKYVKIPSTIIAIEWIVGIAILGAIFGLIMIKTMKFRVVNNEKYVTCGIVYLIIWGIALGWKIALSEYMTKVNPIGSYEFMLNHGISINLLVTMFMAFTIAMIIVKIVGTYMIFNIKEKRVLSR